MLTPPGSRETAGSTGGPWWWWGGRERDEAGVATAAGGKETRGRGEEAGAQVVREKGLETETGSGGAGGQRQRGRTAHKGGCRGRGGLSGFGAGGRLEVEVYRVEGEGRPGETQPGRPVHSQTPLAVTQHLPVAGGVLSRIVKVAWDEDEAELGKRLHLPPPK